MGQTSWLDSLRTIEGKNIASYFIDHPADQYPLRNAILTDHGPITYNHLQQLTASLACQLYEMGCRVGDRVLIAIEDPARYIATVFGSAKIGAIAVPVSSQGTSSDYQHYILETAPRFAIVEKKLIPILAQVPQVAGIEVKTFEVPSAGQNKKVRPYMAPAHSPAIILHSSGSTGRQKAVVHSHHGVIANNLNVGHKLFGINSSDCVFSLSKAFHAFGFGFGVCFPLAAGASIVANSSRLNPTEIGCLSAKYRPTVLVGVASTLATLLTASKTWLSLDLSSVRFVISAGEYLSPEVFIGYREHFGLDVLDGFGSTELFHFMNNRPNRAKPGSCGTPAPGCQVALLDDKGNDLEQGAIGSLWVKTESSFLRYWNDDEATALVSRDGWVSTGDKLYHDADGYYFYCGREDDLLKIGGMWASPRQVESLLCAETDIERAFVTTREDRSGNRRLVAYIVMAPNATISDGNILDRLATTLPQHMLPSAIARLAAFPLTPNGKINRSALPAPIWARDRK